MYESSEVEVSDLPEEFKSFITLSTSRQEKVLLCYIVHNTGFLKDQWGVAALTEQRLLCKGYQIFDLAEFRDSLLAEYVLDLHASQQTKYEYNISLIEIRQVSLRHSAVYVDYGLRKLGKRIELCIGLSTGEQANKLSTELKKAIAEASYFPKTLEVTTSSKDIADQIEKLAQLRKDGILSEEEFLVAKRKLLS